VSPGIIDEAETAAMRGAKAAAEERGTLKRTTEETTKRRKMHGKRCKQLVSDRLMLYLRVEKAEAQRERYLFLSTRTFAGQSGYKSIQGLRGDARVTSNWNSYGFERDPRDTSLICAVVFIAAATPAAAAAAAALGRAAADVAAVADPEYWYPPPPVAEAGIPPEPPTLRAGFSGVVVGLATALVGVAVVMVKRPSVATFTSKWGAVLDLASALSFFFSTNWTASIRCAAFTSTFTPPARPCSVVANVSKNTRETADSNIMYTPVRHCSAVIFVITSDTECCANCD